MLDLDFNFFTTKEGAIVTGPNPQSANYKAGNITIVDTVMAGAKPQSDPLTENQTQDLFFREMSHMAGAKPQSDPLTENQTQDLLFREMSQVFGDGQPADTPYPVIGIKDRAFADCSHLKSVILPSSLEYIGKEAFSGCTALTDINHPASLESIGAGAFEGCTSLER